MKNIVHEIPYIPDSRLSSEIFTSSSVFFDIETTGFSPAHTSLYLIGCAFHDEKNIYIRQLFAESPDEEAEILSIFLSLLKDYDTIITFNGIGFDIPYLKAKCQHYALKEQFADFTYVDIFKSVSQIKHILQLPNYKQKTIEAFLGIRRDDLYTGGELIGLYHSYVREPRQDKLETLLLHNYEDVLDMPKLLPVLSYVHLFSGHFISCQAAVSDYMDYAQKPCKELLLSIEPEFAFPKHISCRMGPVYFYAKDRKCTLSIHVEEDALKYFFPNYKDYYYLPTEDTAMHKSVASFVDKEHRKQATAATCYMKHEGMFLPQYEELITPSFKKDYKEKISYFELTDKFLASTGLITHYVNHLLASMKNRKIKE